MSQILGSCGHPIDLKGIELNAVWVKEHNREGKRDASYRTLCEMCKGNFAKEKLILESQEEKARWVLRKRSKRQNGSSVAK